MRCLIQRVRDAEVVIDGVSHGKIGQGLMILVGITHNDTWNEVHFLAEKTAHLRIFSDENGKMNRSLLDVKGAALIVSQFTLYGDARHGRRPDFLAAARPDTAIPLYEAFLEEVAKFGIPVESGIFGADMLLEIHNDGPVTLMLEANAQEKA